RSARRKATGTGSPRWSRRRRSRSTWRPWARTAQRSRRSPGRSRSPTTPTRRTGGGPTSAPPTGTAMPGRGRGAWRRWSPAAVARGGEVDGVRLLGPETIDVIFREQLNGVDLVLGVPLRLGIGYGLPLAALAAYIPGEKICFWGGWGGSLIVMDLGRRMTVSY